MISTGYEKQAYWAGLIDGEGCIGVYKRNITSKRGGIRWDMSVSIMITNLSILEKIKKEYGGNISNVPIYNENWKRRWKWKIGGKPALYLVAEIYPWLHIKRREAEEFLKILHNHPGNPTRIGHTDEWNQFVTNVGDELKRLKRVA